MLLVWGLAMKVPATACTTAKLWVVFHHEQLYWFLGFFFFKGIWEVLFHWEQTLVSFNLKKIMMWVIPILLCLNILCFFLTYPTFMEDLCEVDHANHISLVAQLLYLIWKVYCANEPKELLLRLAESLIKKHIKSNELHEPEGWLIFLCMMDIRAWFLAFRIFYSLKISYFLQLLWYTSLCWSSNPSLWRLTRSFLGRLDLLWCLNLTSYAYRYSHWCN